MEMKSLAFTYDIESTHSLPFITMIEGCLEGMCFLIDSGSTECILFNKTVDDNLDKLTPLSDKGTIWGVGGITYETTYVGAVVAFCGRESSMMFQVVDNAPSDKLFEKIGIRMHGIIGANFLRANNVLIDFVNQRILVAPPEFKKTA